MGSRLRVLWFVLVFELLVDGHLVGQNDVLENEATRFEFDDLEVAINHTGDFSSHGERSNDPGMQTSLSDGDHFSSICDPHGHQMAGTNSPTPKGMALEKVQVLLVSAAQAGTYKSFGKFPTAAVPCDLTHLSHLSEKCQLYPQTIKTFLTMRKSKSGLQHFKMIPEPDLCEENDVPANALLQMVTLGERFASKYDSHVLPTLYHSPQGNIKIVRSLPGQAYFQSAAAFVHGLLPEKQFMHVQFQKMESHLGRGLDSHCWCDRICHIDAFMRKSYRDEHEVFKDHEMVFNERRKLYEDLGVDDYQPAKQIVQAVSHWLCEARSIPCQSQQCLSINATHINQLFHAIQKHNQYLSSNDLFISYAVAGTFPYFQEMFSNFHKVTSQERFQVDVVDDFFLMKVLSVLGISVHNHISPGSQLVVEQYRKAKSQSAAKFWRVLYDDDVITDNIPSCRDGHWQGICGADTIRSHVENLAEKNRFGVCSFNKDEL